MKKGIIIGFGILIVLVLAGNASAYISYSSPWAECTYCHAKKELTIKGNYYNETHKFDGIEVPATSSSCAECHTSLTTFLPLTSMGQSYNASHRYNGTTLASTRLAPPACANCHTDVSKANFNLLTGTPTYVTSTACENCHKQKYDTWYNGTHRIKLTDKDISEAAGYPTPPGYGWDDILYTVGGKWKIRFVNTSGYVITGTQAQYDVEEGKWSAYESGKVLSYNCGGCHTTGYNKSAASRFGLPGIVGNWTENGVGCEACHGAAGNGHQVVVNKSAELCGNCHTRDAPTKYDIDKSRRHRAQYADWINSAHASPSKAPVTTESCRRCHSPFDYAEGKSITAETASGIVCAVCHNPHDISDPKYADLTIPGGFGYNPGDNSSKFADVKPAKVSFFNSSASKAAGKDIYDILTTSALIYDRDSNYPGPINVTGPVSEVLCSQCHYNHGLSYTGQVNLSHAKVYPTLGREKATCTDCHMPLSRKSATVWDIRSHTMEINDGIAYTTAPTNNFPDLTCSRGTGCHVTSDQNLNKSKYSVVPVVNEWKESAHNNFDWRPSYSSSCARCHSPMNWNPLNSSATITTENSKGVTCAICHNFHDMGDWLDKTRAKFGEAKAYAWYDRDGLPRRNAAGVITGYRANYSMMESTTELCTNCHVNRPEYSVPGWGSRGPHGAVVPHQSSQGDMFIGSWKESSALKFECKDCHMYTKTIDPTNLTEKVLPDSQKVTGHTFKVNAAGLGAQTACSGCHAEGSMIGSVTETIEDIQTDIKAKWNTANTTVENAWGTYNAYTGEKNLSSKKLAEAFFKLYKVDRDRSWGVHNPMKAKELLSDAERLADEAITTLGQKEVASTVQLKAGWNLVALNGTPAVTSAASVMSSVASNITVVWGYNTANTSWELYDPTMPSSLNTLKNIVPGKGYWIYAKEDVEWTA